ncbi:MAG: PBP1A family penicillin-binding protein [Treponema sp.]|nr:PBP1A family penicillin-binding protein [Treponema sp.]
MKNFKIRGIVYLLILFIFSGLLGTGLGSMLAATQNIKNEEHFTEFNTALPTKLLDINGELITEFSNDEKREIISFQKLPQHVVDALITREDRIFFSHSGLSFKAIFRAFAGKLTGNSLGGGSTLTQQIAGTLYCDRTEMSISRKLKELWWALQMERRYSKNEILEIYLNKIYFGGGTYGVNAASKYYFGHDATEISPAEASLLVVQLSNPAWYNPFEHPNRAMDRQQDVLANMVDAGYITQAEADASYEEFWDNFDFSRTSASAYLLRDDKAPWFSEYVRRELGTMLYGSDDIYSSGFTVNTTLNLAHENIAQGIMEEYIAKANRNYKAEFGYQIRNACRRFTPLSELLALMVGIPNLRVGQVREEMNSKLLYVNEINPVIEVVSLITANDLLKNGIAKKGKETAQKVESQTTIEGTMISMESGTGFINALIGGGKYDARNQFIRATQAYLQPGSTFKPLYYSAAIDSRRFTPTTLISDTPMVFYTAAGEEYVPENYAGHWKGDVTVWFALTRSLNIPSIKVLDGIGFDAAINRSSALLGVPDEELVERSFIEAYALALGVCSVRPIELCRAFAVFENEGKAITPIAIRTIENRNGEVILNPELDAKSELESMGSGIQIISPQNAFVMTKMLEQTVTGGGTLGNQRKKLVFKDENGKEFRMPAAGKTGTTQEWRDAWTVGFTPYYTAAFWFGFDTPGISLGMSSTGAALAGFAWGDFFQEIHRDLPVKQFHKPKSGVTSMTVCYDSGYLLCDDCEKTTTQWFLSGTQPTEICPMHSYKTPEIISTSHLQDELALSGVNVIGNLDVSGLELNLDFLDDDYVEPTIETNNSSENEVAEDSDESDDFNFLLE